MNPFGVSFVNALFNRIAPGLTLARRTIPLRASEASRFFTPNSQRTFDDNVTIAIWLREMAQSRMSSSQIRQALQEAGLPRDIVELFPISRRVPSLALISQAESLLFPEPGELARLREQAGICLSARNQRRSETYLHLGWMLGISRAALEREIHTMGAQPRLPNN